MPEADDVPARISAALRELFGERALTDAARTLSRRGIDASYGTVYAWTTGERVPSFERLAQIEEAFDLPVGWILYRAGLIDPVDIIARMVDTITSNDLENRLRRQLRDFNQRIDDVT